MILLDKFTNKMETAGFAVYHSYVKKLYLWEIKSFDLQHIWLSYSMYLHMLFNDSMVVSIKSPYHFMRNTGVYKYLDIHFRKHETSVKIAKYLQKRFHEFFLSEFIHEFFVKYPWTLRHPYELRI